MSAARFSRRRLLKAGALVSLGGAIGSAAVFYRSGRTPSMLSAATSRSGSNFGVMLDGAGRVIDYMAVPKRSHASTLNQHTGDILFFARRPGNEIFVFSNKGHPRRVITANAGRHFYGHGVLDPDHRYLLTTENHYADGTGRVVVRDTQADYGIAFEFPSYGVGPHELVFLSDRVIAVANGGIRSHPSIPRENLDMDSMAPSVAFIDWQDGVELASFRPSNSKLSLRHLARLNDRQVIVGAQSHDELTPEQSLVSTVDLSGIGTPGGCDPLFAINRKFYIASVCTINDKLAATTSPRSGHLDVWADNQWAFSIPCFDVAGVCSVPGAPRLCFSNGRGDITMATMNAGGVPELRTQTFEGIQWDNHLVAV